MHESRVGSSFGLLLGTGMLLAACGGKQAPPAESPEPEAVASRSSEIPALVGETGEIAVREAPRRVGDRLVHRFSGAYRDEPLVLLEEVVGHEKELLVVDFRVQEGAAPLHLRVRMTVTSERILSVSEMVDGVEEASSLAAYEQLMAQTTFAPDRNEGMIASESQTCLVGESELDCRLSRYAVDVNGEEATLTVARSEAMKRDLQGEITTEDGTVLYKADLVEMRRGPTVASEQDATASLTQTPDWALRK